MSEPAGLSTPSQSDLAVERTRLAYERTLMAWIRTSTSLITFGFSIYKFFQIQTDAAGIKADRLIGSRGFALLMVTIGMVALLVATLEHRRDLAALKQHHPDSRRSPTTLLAALIGVLGLTALISVIFQQ